VFLERLRNFISAYFNFRHSLFKPYQFIIKTLYRNFFNSFLNHPFEDSQKEAIILNEHRSLILSGAGTGKTSTIVGKIGFLLKSKRIKEDEILVLAFNRNAANEITDRINLSLSKNVKAYTFHSLGNEIIRTTYGKSTNVSQLAKQESALNKFMNLSIREIYRDEKLRNKMYDFFSYKNFPTLNNDSIKTVEDYLRWLKSNNLISFNGDKVKSNGELMISNFLFRNGIEYDYEKKYQEEKFQIDLSYNPDFKLKDKDIYIEYYGIDRKGNTLPYINKVEYKKSIKFKRKLHKRNNSDCIELFYYDLLEGNLISSLKNQLNDLKIDLKPIPNHELEGAITKLNYQNDFIKLLKTFLRHYKSNRNRINIPILKEISNNDDRSSYFVTFFEKIYKNYEDNLLKNNEIDFEDMILKSTEIIQNNKFINKWKYIVIDEFQDISQHNLDLINSLLISNPECKLFCVGDDWQSIYRFAGSKLDLFTSFRKIFGDVTIISLKKTFRLNSSISEISRKFVIKNPKQFNKKIISNKIVRSPKVFLNWIRKDSLEAIIDWMKRNKENEFFHGKTLLILARYNYNLPDVGKYKVLNDTWIGKEVLEPKTIHRAKGLEADIVLVLDLNSNRNGFPSYKSDDPILSLLIPNTDNYFLSEERRLFYVSLTRAKCEVHYICNSNSPSLFSDELANGKYEIINLYKEEELKYKCPKCKDGEIISKGDFYSCSRYPLCKYINPECTVCEENLVIVNKESIFSQCSDKECRAEYRNCPECDTGILIKKEKFMGCHTYSWTGCDYKEWHQDNLSTEKI
jgi:DNA helicase IV